MSKLDKEEVIANFTAAYQAANGKAPAIEAKGGWYSVDGGKNVRLAALVDMAQELSGSGSPAPAEKKKASAKKAAAKKATPTASKSSDPAVVSAGKGMKPSDLWKARLEDSGQNCVLPRGI